MNRLSIGELETLIEAWPRRARTLMIGIDGAGGSGKTTLARALAKGGGPGIRVVSIDDFYRPSADRSSLPGEVGTLFDWRRLDAQLLEPLSRDEASNYQRYDWSRDCLGEWERVEAGGVVIVEGVTAIRRELRDRYDFRVLVDCRDDVRLARGLARDGEHYRAVWQKTWMPEERRYLSAHVPRDYAHLVIDGSAGTAEGNQDGSMIFEVLQAAGLPKT